MGQDRLTAATFRRQARRLRADPVRGAQRLQQETLTPQRAARRLQVRTPCKRSLGHEQSDHRRALLTAATATIVATAFAPLAVSRAGSLARVTSTIGARRKAAGVPAPRPQLRRRPTWQRVRGPDPQPHDRRLLAVVSVDGVNVVTGESASPDQSGYVLDPGDYVNIQGWRKDLDRTAAFYFSDPADSYAARTGRPNDLGVIGVALFREREVEPAPVVRRRRWRSTASAESADQAAGRGAGRGGRRPRVQGR